MAEFLDLRADVVQLLQENGRQVALRRYATTTEVTGKPWYARADANFTDEEGIYAVFSEDVKSLINNAEIERGDKALLIASDSVEGAAPTTADKIVDGDNVYAILDISEIRPGTGSILYVLQVRG